MSVLQTKKRSRHVHSWDFVSLKPGANLFCDYYVFITTQYFKVLLHVRDNPSFVTIHQRFIDFSQSCCMGIS